MKKKVYMLFVDILFQVACLFPWIPVGEEYVNTLTYVIRMFRSGDHVSYVNTWLSPYGVAQGGYENKDIEAMAAVFYAQLILLCVLQIIGFLHMLLLVFPIRNMVLYIAMIAVSLVNCLLITEGPELYLFQDSMKTILYSLAMLVIPTVMFVCFRLIESWGEAMLEYHALRKRDKELKKERKRRLRFDGKYSSLYYRVIWENFKSRLEVYRIFLIVGGLSSGFIFAGIGMQEMLKGQELGSAMGNFLVISMIMAIFLIVNVLLFYLKNHMKDYSMFLNLGMRKRTLSLYVGIELVSSILFSIVSGFVLGNAVLLLCRKILEGVKESGVTFTSLTWQTYLLATLCILGIYGVALLATHDIYFDSGMAGSNDKTVKQEKMPGKRKYLFFIIGALISAEAGMVFTKRIMAESTLVLVFFLFGLYLVMKNGWGILLKLGQRMEKGYYRNLLKRNYLYYRFKTAFRYTFFIGIVHICILFVFGKDIVSVMTAQKVEELFPYDYVCLATEEDEVFFSELEETYHADISIYPMARVTNVDNTPRLEAANETPIQGQNIGISESVYQELCKAVGVKAEKLKLSEDGKDIYVCYQQDRSIKGHPIDYYMDRTVPYIRIGSPLFNYSYRNFNNKKDEFTGRKVTGESVDILIGALHQGEQENLIVFSDEYMEQVKDDWRTSSIITGETLSAEEAVEGETIHHSPTRLVLMQVSGEAKQELRERLKEFESWHEFDRVYDATMLSCYDKDALTKDIKSDRVMKITVNVFLSCIIFTAGILMLYLKTESEIEERRRKHEFLICMGMRKKERLRLLRTELGSFLWRPFVFATIVTAFLTGAVWKIRCYSTADCIRYLKVWGALYFVYLIILVLGMKCLEHYVIRKVEK